jgi:aspartyl-tRNA(Asn)/glutamyl-tRNA(Gln) amidotransferase subunit B
MKYEPVIGLEVHARMNTKSKAFCSCSTEYNAPPNTNTCPVCLGHPGTLPVLNKKLVEFILRLGITTNCKITEHSVFARKNYFYPDLPKGYQITQYENPICTNGYIEIKNKKVGIARIHMEEDSAKSIHDSLSGETLLDFNRCGVPLIEIVSEPDLRNSEEVHEYLTKLRQLLLYLDICNGNMEEGSVRCDANVSIRLKGEEKFGTKTEVKNLNSFKNVSEALNAEINRQAEFLERGERLIHETLTYNAKTKKTSSIRSKEEENDYRYFPEPDLVPVHISEEWLEKIRNELPELPDMKKQRFKEIYNIPDYDAEVLSQNYDIANYFENVCKQLNKPSYKAVSNWIMTDIMRILNEKRIGIAEFYIKEKNLSSLINLIDERKISNNIAKAVFSGMMEISDPEDIRQNPEYIVKEKDLGLIDDKEEIESVIKKILRENEKEEVRYRNGETKLLALFIGKVMKETNGKANPKTVNEILVKNLK